MRDAMKSIQSALPEAVLRESPRVRLRGRKRKEDGKLWQHVLTDETVYFYDVALGKTEVRSRCFEWLAEYQSGRLRVDFNFVLSAQRNQDLKFRGVVVGNCRHGFRKFDGHFGGVVADGGVLIQVAQSIQLPQGMRPVILPACMWLQVLNDVDGCGWNIPRRQHELLSAPSTVVRLNGERARARRFASTEQSQLPDEVVERGTQVVGKLTDGDWSQRRTDVEFDVDSVKSMFRVVLFRDGVWVLPKFTEFALKDFEVSCRSVGLHLRIDQPRDEIHG